LKSIGDIEEEMVIYETDTKIDALTSPGLNFEVQDRGKFFAEFYRERFTLRIRYCLLTWTKAYTRKE
jgi:hypothetical protein